VSPARCDPGEHISGLTVLGGVSVILCAGLAVRTRLSRR